MQPINHQREDMIEKNSSLKMHFTCSQKIASAALNRAHGVTHFRHRVHRQPVRGPLTPWASNSMARRYADVNPCSHGKSEKGARIGRPLLVVGLCCLNLPRRPVSIRRGAWRITAAAWSLPAACCWPVPVRRCRSATGSRTLTCSRLPTRNRWLAPRSAPR